MRSSLPEGKLARTSVAGLAVVKVGIGELGHKVKRPFLSAEKKKQDKSTLDDKNAKVFFQALAQLRGTALKVAQMLGMEQGLLPDAYRKELEKSFHQVPPLNRVLVRKAIMTELKQTPEKLFDQFEKEAFAAASLGQVHKATTHDQQKVAVKVQYPGINITIKSDLTMMRGIARGLSNTKIILQSLEEIEARLLEEIDYRIEAKNTQWFAENIKLKGIFVPKVYPDLSSERVLTTEFVEGLHLNDWLATNPSQQQRNQRAQLLYDFFTHSSQDLQCLHSDPNPGNYLFHDDGSITVIDFGCVRQMSDNFVEAYPLLVKGYFEDDPDAIFATYKKLGMEHKSFNHDFYQRVLRPFGQWITEPYHSDSFDFGKYSDYTQRGKAPMKTLHESFKIDYMAEEFIFHNRTYYGLLQIFEKMGATVSLWIKP
ncbi:MAG TPA: AarF/ABC1/UbiB kinase family protein [Leucothrix mucor]|nr:AarF/ABC1/UbiB kinase family protein [Leucothrix mucor]